MTRGRRGWAGGLAALVVALVAAALAPGRAAAASGPADDGAHPGDPVLRVDPVAVHRAMTCAGPAGGGGRNPVLLVHGTFVTAAETFGWNYLPELAARGVRVCTVDLPNRSLDDIQIAAEYVVVAVHRLARESARQVDVIGHSQGVLQSRWAVRWWPSVRSQVGDLVSLAGPNQGTTVAASPLAPLAGCPACLQMAPGSAFLTALNAGDQTPGDVAVTALYSTLIDELITPNATAARIDGASNIEMQALCPGRVVTHVSFLADAVAFSMVLDALGHPGPASPARFTPATCLQTTFVGLPGVLGGPDTLLGPPHIPSGVTVPAAEPPLQPYARAGVAPAPTTRTTTRGAAGRIALDLAVTTSPPTTAPAPGPPPTAPPPPTLAPTPTSAAGPSELTARRTDASRPGGGGAFGVLAAAALVLVGGTTGGMAARRSRRR